ncbi:hypothetical protein FNV43_RR10947 [Rhamnella rubrinervis]|uniref:Bifunctional inhibitor/plant lipid transfer protein/seed storage helical domain-containing protein n=1 Tax=Rhamnella rubrinervis TaxID=2594499 RepID=A0A8K0H5B9_9ROSA|nr:hypothetical protein FNV43_RR10947 [Rhamnella rubrinervis]
MVRMVIVLCMLATWFAISKCSLLDEYEYDIQNAPSMAPSSDDCSVIVYAMSDCVSFLSDGSSDTEPDHPCCSGLETVVETNADCICEAFTMSSQMGIQLNMTRVLALPAACGVPAPPLNDCHIPQPPQSSPSNGELPPQSSPSNGNPPEMSPKSAPSSPSILEPPASETLGPSPSPNKGGGGTAAHAPAPSSAPQIGIPSLLLASFVVCVSICLFLI